MTHDIASLDAFGRDGLYDVGDAGPARLYFGLDTAPPPLRSFQVPFARLELVLDGVYRNALATPAATIASHDLGPGDALFVPAGCWNEPAWDRDVRLISLLFGATHLGVSLTAWNVRRNAFTSVEKRSCVIPGNGPLRLMVEAVGALRDDGIATSSHARLLTRAVVDYARMLLVHPVRDGERHASALYRAACLYIEENFDRVVTREGVAAQLGISPNYFSRIFSAEGSMTFAEHLATVRVAKAKAMLEKYDLPLAEVAKRSGFRDFNYFLKVFKRRVGRTPTEYRQSVAAGAAAG